jgi:hypothetical protein
MEAMMRTIEMTVTVTPDGILTMRMPSDILPGEHRVVLVIDERPVATEKRRLLDFPVDHYGPWPADLSMRREDMYDDWGR